MKAITCSQCGALIKRISLKDKFANCDYCGAKILIAENKERIVEIREKETPAPKPALPKLDAAERDRLFRTMIEQNNDETSYDDTRQAFYIFLTVGIVAFFIFAPVVLVAIFKSNDEETNTKKAEFVSTQMTPTPEEIVYETPAPLPDIKYRSYVQYNTNIDADLIELPIIRLEQLPTTDLKELKKTVFASRKIRVRITIDENGDVTEASALNGHQVLRDSSVEAAKKSLFSSRKRKTTTVLTYIYILE